MFILYLVVLISFTFVLSYYLIFFGCFVLCDVLLGDIISFRLRCIKLYCMSTLFYFCVPKLVSCDKYVL